MNEQTDLRRKYQRPPRIFSFVAFGLASALGGVGLEAQVRTRAEEIEQARREKMAGLWPERESPLVRQANALVERGLSEGVESGKGANGPQIVLGGMRSGQGTTVGIGYRRTDLWRERLGFRTTARGTIHTAVLLDFDLDFQSLRTEKTFLDVYGKFERSPRMDYYGPGPSSSEDNRTSYLYSDFALDANFGVEPLRGLRMGLTGGLLYIHTGTGNRDGVPSPAEVFNPQTTPGLGEDTDFDRWGGFVAFDYRDHRNGPRSGGLYGARFRRYDDRNLDKYGFRQAEIELQQFIPYFNKSRVIALRLATVLTFAEDDQRVPFYLQPTLGGNDDLRGFERYRFYDDNLIIASVEHRWYVFSGLDMAVFADAGKVASHKSDINFSGLQWSAGLGFRVRIKHAVVMRIDFAGGREGFRWMWTFSEIFRSKF